MVTERKFALSDSWRSSATIIGATYLKITDSHFLLQWQIWVQFFFKLA